MSVLLTVAEAQRRVVDAVSPRPPRVVSLSEAAGLCLAEDVFAAVDSPPFDKALMDGFAVRSGGVVPPDSEWKVVGIVTAGVVSGHSVGRGETIRIMTGAPIPAGADCIVPLEQTSPGRTVDSIRIEAARVGPGRNIAHRGESLKAGARMLHAGVRLGPASLGALAEMGRTSVLAGPRPVVAVIATGDELTPVDVEPGPGQIRNSNETMLTAQLRGCGAVVRPLGIARDRSEDLHQRISEGLDADILCLSGGVSAGDRDLVPSVLQQLGVERVFHGVQLRPGKPVWFGVRPAACDPGGIARWVFGLPGNPLSSMVCCELLVAAAVRRLLERAPAVRPPLPGVLTGAYTSRDVRPTYHPGRRVSSADRLMVETVPWRGSFDLQSVCQADCLILFPRPGDYAAGDPIDVFPLD